MTSEAAAVKTFTDMRRHVTVLGAEAPYFLVKGNHDPELGWLLAGAGLAVIMALALRWRALLLGWLLVPYQLWLVTAASLSWGYWHLN